MISLLRELRIAHHQRAANAHGVAALQAQYRRDFKTGAAHLMRSMEHRSKRDELAARRRPAARPDPHIARQVASAACCTHDCDEGRWCPRRIAVATPPTTTSAPCASCSGASRCCCSP